MVADTIVREMLLIGGPLNGKWIVTDIDEEDLGIVIPVKVKGLGIEQNLAVDRSRTTAW